MPFARHEFDIAEPEYNPFAHKYLIKRPVIKDYLSNSRSISLQNTRTNQENGQVVELAVGSEGEGDHSIDNPMVEKHRFELFIDLIWVGIIGNLTDHYSEQAFTSESRYTVGQALGEAIVLFLIAVRMWKNLQEFMTKYHTSDFVERMFVIWYLALATLYGNNAVYLLDAEKESNTAIGVYLVSKGSLLAIEIAYSIFLPIQRRGILVRTTIVGWISSPFFIAAAFQSQALKTVLLTVGIALEYSLAALVDTPLFENFLREERARPWDSDHWVERIQDFFIIILGEGVLNLIRGSTLGVGLTRQSGMGVLALMMYYLLSSLFFSGDQSRKYVHAVRRSFWTKSLWLSQHTIMFLSTLLLGVSVVYLIQHDDDNAVLPDSNTSSNDADTSEAFIEATQLANFIYTAKWSASVSISVTMACLSGIAFLSRSLDEPGTMIITNRYGRLSGRVVFLVVALCLPIDRAMSSVVYLSILVGVLFMVRTWELVVSLEKSGGLFEP